MAGATLRSDTARKSSWFYCQTKKRLVKQTISLDFRHLQSLNTTEHEFSLTVTLSI